MTQDLSIIQPPDIESSSKKDLTRFAVTLAKTIRDDGYDSPKFLAYAAKQKHLWTEVVDEMRPAAFDAVSRYGRAGVNTVGVQLTCKETGVTFDYSHDPDWQALKARVDEATEALKRQQELLKTLPREGKTMVSEITGDIYTAYPPLRRASDTVETKIN